MSDLEPKHDAPDWDDGGWEEDRLRYESDIASRKQASMAQSQPPTAMAVSAASPLDGFDDNAPPIPFPLSDKPEYFPGFIARSALFQAGRPGAGDVSELRRVRSQKHYDVTVTGPRLTMRDKRVWEIAMQIAKEASSDMCQAFEIALNDFAERMGLADRSSKTLGPIWASLQRLSQVRVSFKLPAGHEGSGSLLATAVKIEGRTYLRVNPDFTWAAFSLDFQFHIQSARRGALSSSLAQWLHDFLSTHTDNIDFTVDYLRSLSGHAGAARNFPEALRKALDELVVSVPALVAAYSIDEQGKSSDRWVVKLTRGPEKPQFAMPKAHAAGGGSKAPAAPVWAAKRRKGGLVL
jgi:hypothetical protein